MKKRFLLLPLLTIVFTLFAMPISNFSYANSVVSPSFALEKTIEELINWKKLEVGSNISGNLINDNFLKSAGSTDGDWFPIGLGRYSYPDNYRGYLATITDNVNSRYKTNGKLHTTKATEWHRISLAITAMGGNPLSFGEFEGNPINLIADGTYNRGQTVSPGRQGLNGWIWALISLDSKRHNVTNDAYHQRQDFIVEILRAQLADGGFALSGTKSDPDISAMAIQALAPYYNSEIQYQYVSSKLKDNSGTFVVIKKTVRQIVDETIAFLSGTQTTDGDFASWGMQNLESTCQVLVGLNSLGIDALNDNRFIKNGKTLLDGIMKYQLTNGGFLHSYTSDPENPTSSPTEANTMASGQALYTLVSLWRYNNGMRTLYDMRSESSELAKSFINNTIKSIDTLDKNSTAETVLAALNRYKLVDSLDRSYVTNYWKLSDYVTKFKLREQLPNEEILFSGSVTDEEEYITEFTDKEKQAVADLPNIEKLDTSYLSLVTELRFTILNCSNDFEDKSHYKIFIEKAYNQILLIDSEIKAINLDITEKLHPFDNIGIKDKKTIYSLIARFDLLSEHDKLRISHYEDLLKCKTQVDNLVTAAIISSVGLGLAAALTTYIIFSIKKKKKAKLALQMSESEE